MKRYRWMALLLAVCLAFGGAPTAALASGDGSAALPVSQAEADAVMAEEHQRFRLLSAEADEFGCSFHYEYWDEFPYMIDNGTCDVFFNVSDGMAGDYFTIDYENETWLVCGEWECIADKAGSNVFAGLHAELRLRVDALNADSMTGAFTYLEQGYGTDETSFEGTREIFDRGSDRDGLLLSVQLRSDTWKSCGAMLYFRPEIGVELNTDSGTAYAATRLSNTDAPVARPAWLDGEAASAAPVEEAPAQEAPTMSFQPQSDGGESSLVGEWRYTWSDGLGNTFQFNPDGTVVWTRNLGDHTDVSDGQYEVTGSYITFFGLSDLEEYWPYEYRLEGDRLSICFFTGNYGADSDFVPEYTAYERVGSTPAQHAAASAPAQSGDANGSGKPGLVIDLPEGAPAELGPVGGTPAETGGEVRVLLKGKKIGGATASVEGTLKYDCAAREVELTVEGSGAWTTQSSAPEWIAVPENGFGGQKITVHLAEAPVLNTRSGVVAFRCGDALYRLAFEQENTDAFIVADEDGFSLMDRPLTFSAAQPERQITVACETKWSFGRASGLLASRASGESGNTTVTLVWDGKTALEGQSLPIVYRSGLFGLGKTTRNIALAQGESVSASGGGASVAGAQPINQFANIAQAYGVSCPAYDQNIVSGDQIQPFPEQAPDVRITYYAQSGNYGNKHFRGEYWGADHPNGSPKGCTLCMTAMSLGALASPRGYDPWPMPRDILAVEGLMDGMEVQQQNIPQWLLGLWNETVTLKKHIARKADEALSAAYSQQAERYGKLDAALLLYLNDPTRNSPPVVRIYNNDMGGAGSDHTHSVLVLGKLNATTYRIMDSSYYCVGYLRTSTSASPSSNCRKKGGLELNDQKYDIYESPLFSCYSYIVE